VFIRVVVRWMKRGVWVSVGVGRRIWTWVGGRGGVVVVDGDGDVDEGGDEDDGVDLDVDLDIVFFFLSFFGCEWVRCCRLVWSMAVDVCV
jgi:hypothetical protein